MKKETGFFRSLLITRDSYYSMLKNTMYHAAAVIAAVTIKLKLCLY